MRVGALLPNIGDQVWLMTSKQTDPLLQTRDLSVTKRWQNPGRREYSQFIDIRVEDLVHEANAGGLERVLIWKLHMNLPHAAREWSYTIQRIHDQQN